MDAQIFSCVLGHIATSSFIALICLSIGYHIAFASHSQNEVQIFQDSPIAACLTAHSIFCHKFDIQAILILFHPVPGIFKGIYFGASTAFQVILSADNAAITTIQRITSAKTLIIIVEIIHFHTHSTQFTPQTASFERTHIVLKETSDCHSQKVNVCVCGSDDTIFIFAHSKIHPESFKFGLSKLMTAHKNINQNAKAAETYTGTIASDMNFFIVICSSSFFIASHHFQLKKYVSAKSGENIMYIQSIVILEKSANTIATTRIQKTIKNINQKLSFFAISQICLIHSSSVGSIVL